MTTERVNEMKFTDTTVAGWFNTSRAGGLEHYAADGAHAVCNKSIRVRIGLLANGSTGPWIDDEPTGLWPMCPRCRELAPADDEIDELFSSPAVDDYESDPEYDAAFWQRFDAQQAARKNRSN